MSDDQCVFCEIVRGDVESSVVYDDADVLAFMDLRPVTPGHLLVVPKTHAAGLEDLDVEHGQKIWAVGQQLSRVLRRSGLRCDGINLFLADGEAAFQEVFHVHLHVFPRFAGDSFRIAADWRERARSELDGTAAVLRETLATLVT
ncbi:HIT family protein [Saccharopolyspora sp. 5N102]|uniref:HIT family protein n=1 Tax=Saccharopolyspora sp. 5N102 TaxID=3375155 RepID=UPI0037926D1F